MGRLVGRTGRGRRAGVVQSMMTGFAKAKWLMAAVDDSGKSRQYLLCWQICAWAI